MNDVLKMDDVLRKFEEKFGSEMIDGEKYIFLRDAYVDGYEVGYWITFAYNVNEGKIYEFRYPYDENVDRHFNEPSDYIDWGKPSVMIWQEFVELENFMD